MKKILALTMALVLVLSLGACGKAPAAETKAPTEADVSVTEKAAETEAARPHFDKLTLEFVPSKRHAAMETFDRLLNVVRDAPLKPARIIDRHGTITPPFEEGEAGF